MKTDLLVVVAFALLVPGPVEATEEKPVSMEAVMEEISALRTLIAEQQRQIERLQNALNIPAVVLAVGSPVAQAQTPVPSAVSSGPAPSTRRHRRSRSSLR